jgi:hypothetical protein
MSLHMVSSGARSQKCRVVETPEVRCAFRKRRLRLKPDALQEPVPRIVSMWRIIVVGSEDPGEGIISLPTLKTNR